MTSTAPRNLLQFKAGQCFREGDTKTVRPDPTKGLVYMAYEDDGLLHFYWKNRTTNAVDDDLILFPGDAEVVPVPQCTTGRVIMLQFRSSSQKLFFWLQEANSDRDQIIIAEANSLINHGLEDTGVDGDVTMEEADDHDNPATSTNVAVSTPFAPAASAQASVNPTHTPSTTAAPTLAIGSQPGASSLQAQQMEQLRNLLSGIQVPQSALRQRSNLRLDHILTPGAVEPLLQNEQHLANLYPHLPDDSPRSPAELQAVIRSPQFRQALVSLSSALDSGQLGPLLRQFGLSASAGDGVDGLLRAIEEQVQREKQG
ncbi:hypothetical protein DFQ26_000138 [Actinomortierella ambigua]|nr:hypothetical protein DFQ26_000138 [Actinomortierella ambigua]